MDLIDSMKWIFKSQRSYRLAVFRTDKSSPKVVTDKFEIFWSVLLIIAIAAEVSFIGYKVYFEPPENFFQTKAGEKYFQTFGDSVIVA